MARSNLAATEPIDLPPPRRGGWYFMLFVGVALLGLAAYFGVQAAPQAALFLSGLGAFFAGFAALMLQTRESAAELVPLPSDNAFVFRDDRGGEVTLPAAEFRAAACVTNPRGGDSGVITLHKRDGGVLELMAMPERFEAERLVKQLERMLAALRPEAFQTPTDADVEALRGQLRGVNCTADDDGISFSWSTTPPWISFAGPLLPTAMALMALGAGAEGWMATGIIVAIVIIDALLLAVLLREVGSSRRITLGADALILERRRGAKVHERKELPYPEIAAVDYSHRLASGGASLRIRPSGNRAAQEKVMRQAMSDGSSPLADTLQLIQVLTEGEQIPCGKLSLATKLGLDVAIGQAINQRRDGDAPL